MDWDHYVLDENHNPVIEKDLIAWGRWMETNQRIAVSEIGSSTTVSTVFVGCPMCTQEPKILFETMIFSAIESLHMKTWRYETWKEAIAGHEGACELARRTRQ